MSEWVRVKVCCPFVASVKLVADLAISAPVSSEGSELGFTVKVAVPPVRSTAVEPSDCKKVKFTCLVSPLITLAIVFPVFAI